MADFNEPAETQTFTSTYGTDEQDWAGKVRSLYWDGIQGLRTELRDYWLNHSFLHGYQWLYWSEQAGRLDELPSDPERVQATINRIWPNTRTVIGTLMQRSLAFEVPPTAADDSHMRGARLAETIARSIHHDHNWEEIREHLYLAVLKGGTAAICIDWDDDLQDTVGDDVEGGDPLETGATYEEHLNITQFMVEPGSRNAERARWWIKAVALPPQQVQNMFDLEDLPPADATAGLAPFHRKLMSYDRGGDAEITNLTSVLTYYERPNPDCEDGKVVVVVDQQVVFEADWPFPFTDKLNLVVVRETPRENRWTGDTVMTAARPVQTLLNVAWSSIAEHMKLAGNARLLVPYSSIEIMQNATDLPGEILPYNDSMQVKPDYLSPPQMPGWWLDMPNRIASELDDIMGVHDISRGAAPANIESGFGLTILAEQDATPLARLTKETSQAFGRLMTLALQIYEDKTAGIAVKRRSMVRIPGNAPLDITWNGEDLRGQTTALVPIEAIQPRSRASQMEVAKDMLAAGLIESLPEFIAISELPSAREVLAITSPDVDRARRENAKFGLGRQCIPYPWDDHQAHIDEHNKYRKTVDFDLLSEEDREMIEDHIKAHETLAASQVGERRSQEAVDPALAQAPSANAAPILDPAAMIPPGGAGGPAPPGVNGLPMAAQEALEGPGLGGEQSPDQAASEIMQLMRSMEGG